MKEWVVKHKNEIITSVITAFIVSTVMWLGEKIIKALPAAGNSIFSAFFNILYSLAATEHSNSSSMVIIALVFGALLGAFLWALWRICRIRMEQKKLEKMQKFIEEELNKSEDTVPISEKQETIEKLINTSKPKHKQRKAVPIVVAIVLLIYTILSFVLIIVPINLRGSFEVATRQIKPYITEADMNILESKWTLMRNKADYDEINEYIYMIRKNNDLIK